ncbi:SDR family oxidoreductase [Salinimicrobium catena]|uniref:SDR family oxidoreductase n=1 Tax=Salinimicrobium catena TaxID=390640 RepID=UPI002FE47D72
MTTLEEKVAFVTGGSKGIGYGIAAALAQMGVNVGITSRHKDEAEKAAHELTNEGGGQVMGFEADVRSLESQETALKKLTEKFGQLDILVANAGVGHFGSIEELTAEQWQQTIDTNLTGVFYSMKAALPYLKSSKGYVFTISSLAGTNFFAGGAAYNASKFGVTGFTQAAMLDLREHDIKVTTIMPGSVATYFNDHTPSHADSWKIQIEDIGELVVDLLKLNHRALPSKIEMRPTRPPKK